MDPKTEICFFSKNPNNRISHSHLHEEQLGVSKGIMLASFELVYGSQNNLKNCEIYKKTDVNYIRFGKLIKNHYFLYGFLYLIAKKPYKK